MITRLLALFSLWTFVTFSSSAQTNLSQPLDRDTSVVTGRLDNGLTYYIRPNGRPSKKVELRLVVKAGSLQEDYDQQGLAHFMEHMEFNGLQHYPKNALVDYLQGIGVRFGADLNANTGWDRTYYILPIPTDDSANLEKGFQILGDWATGAIISPEEVENERKVILEEARMRNKNVGARMATQYFPDLLNHSRYAYRLAIGKDSIIQFGAASQIKRYYHDWYRPDLMAVVVVGDIQVDQAKVLVTRYLGGLKNPPNERPRIYYRIPAYTTAKAMVLRDKESPLYRVTLFYPAHAAIPEQTVGAVKSNLISQLFIQSLNTRLSNLARQAHPPYAGAQASLSGSIGDISLKDEGFDISVVPIDDVRKSFDTAINALRSAATFGFTPTELENTKRAILAVYENQYNERNNTPSANYAEQFTDAFMDEVQVQSIQSSYGLVKELLATLSDKEINEYGASLREKPENFFILATGPDSGNIVLPSKEGLHKMVDSAFEGTVIRSPEQDSNRALLDRKPISGKILRESKDSVLGVTMFTLSNQVTVTVKQTTFQNDQVLLAGLKYGGTNQYGLADKVTVSLLPSIINTMGFGNHTPSSLSALLSGHNVQLSIGMSALTNELSGASSVKDLETLMKLLYLEITSPRLDTPLLNGWLGKIAARLPLLKDDPQTGFRDTLNKLTYGNSPLSPIVLPTETDLNAIKPSRALDIWQTEFGNADGLHLFLVGNVNLDSLRPLMENYIASLPAKGLHPTYSDNGLRMVEGIKTLRYYKGVDQKSQIVNIYHGNITYSKDLPLKADMLAQVMTIRLIDTVREKMQAIYSGSVSASVSKLPYGHYTLVAEMPCGPENVEAIYKELDKECADYKAGGILPMELEKVKKALIEQYREAVKENGTWLNELEQVQCWGASPYDFLHFEQRVASITLKDLTEVANQLLGGNNIRAASFPAQIKEPEKPIKADQ